MGRKLFGVDIQSEVAKAMPKGSMPVFYLKKGAVSYESRGNMGMFSLEERDDDKSIQRGDQKIVLIAEPLDRAGVEPATHDIIVDDAGKNYTVVKARTNSARATWICQCRG